MSHLESGNYLIESVDFSTGEPVIRPLGLGHIDGRAHVVVLPIGAISPRWRIERVDEDDHYTLTVEGHSARPDGDLIALSSDEPGHRWFILRSAPSPPPIGINNFGIFASRNPQRSWLLPRSGAGNEGDKVPVNLGDTASSIFISPLER